MQGSVASFLKPLVVDVEQISAHRSRITLEPLERQWLVLLLEHYPAEPDLDAVTALVYGVPKLARGMSLDADPTDEVKSDQKAFFRLLYNLLVSARKPE